MSRQTINPEDVRFFREWAARRIDLYLKDLDLCSIARVAALSVTYLTLVEQVVTPLDCRWLSDRISDTHYILEKMRIHSPSSHDLISLERELLEQLMAISDYSDCNHFPDQLARIGQDEERIPSQWLERYPMNSGLDL
jgi:hypothetical protein